MEQVLDRQRLGSILDVIEDIGALKALDVVIHRELCPLHAVEALPIPDIDIDDLGDVRKSWARSVHHAIGNIHDIERQTRAKMLRLLSQTRKEVWQRVSSVTAEQWQITYARSLVAELDVKMDELRRGFETVTAEGVEKMFYATEEGMTQMMRAGLGDKLFLAPRVSPEILSAATSFWQNQYVSMTAAAKTQINSIIQTTVLAGRSPYSAAQLIAPKLTTPSVFKTLANRAEAIARTETMHVHSIASQDGISQMAKRNPRVRKIWVSVLDPKRTRPSHAAAHFRYQVGGSVGPIKHDEMFVVGGSNMMYPRDAAGPAKEVVQCMCVLISVVVEKKKRKKKKK